ncbi:MAG: efflux RND transporter permease subunit [Alphaproteobacteria bacterium]
MTGIIDAAIGRTRTVLFTLLIGIFAGLVAYWTIPKEADPNIPIPFIFVSLTLQGISPDDAERLLVKPVEKELKSVEGLKEMQAYAAQGSAGITLEFDVNFDKEKALADVREKVDLARSELPEDADEPVVREFNTSTFPVIVVTLSGPVPERTLFYLAQQLEEELEGISGVLQAQLSGQREELLEVVIDPAKLETYDVSQTELLNAITRNNRLVAAGSMDTGEGRFSVKVPGLFETAQDVYELPIKVSGDGIVTLGDLADIRRTFQDRNGYARFNGNPAISIQVTKRVGENIIEINKAVRATVAESQKNWPDPVQVDFIADQSDWINRSLSQLEASILTAISLVMVVVVAALGLRSALLVGIAIPSSFLFGFLIMETLGLTMNFMVMFGLLLSVGILVDGAIVVVEYADRKMAEGLHRREAYALAAKRMFWPVTSSTLTTLAAFFPMLFWPGVSGKFMSYLPITLITVLSAALIVALIFLPVLGSVFGKAEAGNSKTLKALAASETGDLRDLGGLTGLYVRAVASGIRHPLLIMLVVVAVLYVIVDLYSVFGRGVEFFVETEPEQAYVLVSARGNLSVEEARDLVVEVEDIVAEVDGIRASLTTTQTVGSAGGGPGSGGGGELPPDIIGQILIELAPWEERQPGKVILQEIRDRTANLAGRRVEVRAREDGPPTGKDIQIELSSLDYAALQAATARVSNHLASQIDGVIELEDTRPLPGFEWVLRVDRERAGRFGADITTIGATVQLVTNGILIDTYRPDDAEDEIDIRARFPEEYRTVDQLDTLRIRTNDGLVPISNFVKREAQPRVAQIDRLDGRRIMLVRANVAGGGAQTAVKVAEVREWLETEANLDPRVRWRFRGADEESQRSAEFLGGAMLASLFLMFVILLTQFNNFYHAILILSTVVLSTIGVLVGMMVMGQTFSVIMTGTGIVALAGIVVNNNIVLIDTFQRLVRDGLDLREAVVRTAAQRVRPVLLTTITTMCGLLPMMFALNVDFFGRQISVGGPVAVWWVQLATAVVFGLGFATVLTLVITPVMLAAPTHFLEQIRRLFGRARAKQG